VFQKILGAVFLIALAIVVGGCLFTVGGIAYISIAETYRDQGWIGLVFLISMYIVGIGGVLMWFGGDKK
jgi:hypothetical protein